MMTTELNLHDLQNVSAGLTLSNLDWQQHISEIQKENKKMRKFLRKTKKSTAVHCVIDGTMCS